MACNPVGQYDRRKNQFLKIRKVDEMVNAVIVLDPSLEKVNEVCGTLPEGEFDEVVDFSKAHQHLTTLMHQVEYRFAYVVTNYKNNHQSLEAVASSLQIMGEAIALAPQLDMTALYEGIQSCVLDGMPCDETVVLDGISATEAKWHTVMDTHQPFFEKVNGDVNDYYWLLEHFLKGLLKNNSVTFTKYDGPTFTLVMK